MCADRNAMEWIEAWLNKKEPPKNKVGFMYMLAGGTDASNTDPYAQKPEANNNWVETVHRSRGDGPMRPHLPRLCGAVLDMFRFHEPRSALAVAICGVCAEACDRCAAECGEHQAEHCRRCAEACRRCAAECRKMAA